MADKYAGLSLGVDVSQVDNAVKSLQRFKQANEQAAKGVESFVNQEVVAKQKAKDFASELSRQRKEFSNIQNAIDPTAAKMRKLQEAASDLDRLWRKGFVPDESFFRLSEMLESQVNKLDRNRRALTEEGRAALEESKAKERAASAGRKFLLDLEEQATALGKTRSELLEIKAAQLGVSAQAAPFINQLKSQEKQMRLTGISAGQYSQAMRMLPAQITDVVTSLASGMPVWMVAIQQGGQIKDSFGGVGNTFKVLLSYLTPTRLVLGGIVTVMGAFAAAAWDSYKSTRELNKALIMTNGYAASSSTELKKMAASVSESSYATIGAVTEIATKIAASGKYTGESLKQLTKLTADWAAVTGESGDKIIKAYDDISKDPVNALFELNKQMHFLNEGDLTRIATLEKVQGRQAAVTEALRIYREEQERVVNELAEMSTPLEKMWNDIKKWSSEAWDSVGAHTKGALNLIIDVVDGTIKQVQWLLQRGDLFIAEFISGAASQFAKLPGSMGEYFKGVASDQEQFINRTKSSLAELSKQIDEIDARVAGGEMGEAYQGSSKKIEQSTKATTEAINREKEALDKRNKASMGGVSAASSVADQYTRDIVALQAQLDVLKQHKSINDSISDQRKSLYADLARVQVLEEQSKNRVLTQEEKSFLLNKDKIIALSQQRAAIGDQIVEQQRLNKLEDESFKFITKTNAAMMSLDVGAGLGDLAAKRQQELSKIQADYVAQGGAISDQQLQRMIEAQEAYYAKEDQLRSDWLAGARSAFASYGEAANDMYTNMGTVATSALNGVSDMMTQFLMTGKADFKSFATSIISMIIKMIAQMVIFNTLSSAFGGFSGGFSFAKASGGAAAVPASTYANGGYTGDGGKYEPAGIAHKGEFIFTKEATKRIGVGNLNRIMRGYANGGVAGGTTYSGSGGIGSMTSFNFGDINVNAGGMGGQDPKGMEKGIKMIFTEMIQKACSQGGEVYNFVKANGG